MVDHVQELKSAAVGRGIELEVHTPQLVRMLGTVTPHCAVCGSCPLSLPGRGPLQVFLPPESLHALVIHGSAHTPQEAVRHLPAPEDVRRTARCTLQRDDVPSSEGCLGEIPLLLFEKASPTQNPATRAPPSSAPNSVRSFDSFGGTYE